MRPARAIACHAVLALAAGLCATSAWASPSQADIDSARAHYKRGVQLYDQGAYTEALAELGRANQLAPTYKLLYNLALVQMRLGDWAGALGSFRSYLDGGGAELSADRRAEVERFLADVTAHVVTITVTTNVDGATIAVDDVILGVTPLSAPIQLNPGPHRVVATKAGMTREARDLDLASGDRLGVSLTLLVTPAPSPVPPLAPILPPAVEPAPPAPAPALAPPPPEPSRAKAPAPVWIGWVVTGTLAAGSIGTGIAALAESHTLRDELAVPTPGATIHSTHATTVGLALASDVLAGAAIAAGGVTLYFSLTPPGSSAGAGVGQGRAVRMPAGTCVTARF